MVQDAGRGKPPRIPLPATVVDPANKHGWILVAVEGAEPVLIPRDPVLQIEWLIEILAHAGADGPAEVWEFRVI